MSDDRRIVIPSHVMLREVGGETVLLNLDSETYFGLDEVGTEVLRELRTGASVDEAIDLVLPNWAIDRDTLASDVVELIDALVDQGLVSWS